MDAIELLKLDHERIKSLFRQIRLETGSQQRILLFANIRYDLENHTYIEETVFYPAFKKYPQFRNLLELSYEEHHAVKDLLSQITALVKAGEHFGDKLEELIAHVDEHVEEEETEFFPRVRQVMKRSDREVLGRHMSAAKNEHTEEAA